MKIWKKVLSVLLVLTMAASGLGAVPAAVLRDDPAEQVQETEPVPEADTAGETSETVGTTEPVQSAGPETEATGQEPAAETPDGQNQPETSSEDAGLTQESAGAAAPAEQSPSAEASNTGEEPADEAGGEPNTAVDETGGEPNAATDEAVSGDTAMMMSLPEIMPLSLEPEAVTASVYMEDMVYGDTPKDPVASISGPGDYGEPTFTYSKQGESGQTLTAGDLPRADVGTYTVTAAWGSETASVEFEITERPVTIFASKHVEELVPGNEQEEEFTKEHTEVKGLATGDTLESFSGTITGTGKGTYAKFDFNPSYVIKNGDTDVTGNYDVTVLGVLVIEDNSSRADYTATVTVDGWVYGETPAEPKAGVTNGGDEVPYTTGPEIKYYNAEGELVTPSTTTLPAGTYTVTASWDENSYDDQDAPALTAESAFTVTKRPATLTSGDGEFEYDGSKQSKEEVVKQGFLTGDEEKITVSGFASITDVRESGKANTFQYEAEPEIKANYDIQCEYGKLTMAPFEVTVTATGEKPLGTKDKDDHSEYKVQLAPDVTLPVPGDEADVLAMVPVKDLTREPGEAVGTYNITLANPVTPKGENYTIKFNPGTFTIKAEDMQWVPVITDEKIGSHTDTVNFTIEPAAGTEQADLIGLEDLLEQLDVSLVVEVPAGTQYVTQDEIAEISEKVPAEPGAWIIKAPVVDYTDGDGHAWQSYLPAGAALSLTAAVKETDPAVEVASDPQKSLVVEAVEASLEVKAAGGTATGLFEDESGDRLLLDKEGTVTVAPAKDGAEFIGQDDWIVLTAGSAEYIYSAADTSALRAALGVDETAELVNSGVLTLTMDQLKLLAGVSGEEGEWFGTNPAGALTVEAVLLDNVHHKTEPSAQNVAFDTGTKPSTQDVENRAETITITLEEPVGSEQPTVEGTFGGSTPQITSDGTETLTWANIADWKNTPDTLPHSGDTITIKYKDRVGNEGTHTLTVVKSAAVTNNTIYVKPMTDRTVPSGKLNFYGETNVWEPLTVTIGGTSFTVDPLAGGSVYDNSSRQWSVVVDLDSISFPVGQPTQASAAYDELLGGDASIVITYKDAAQEPVMGSEAIVGATALWGYVESSASVMIDIRHADGSVTAVPADNVAVDQFGYFYARLNEALAAGDVVVITTTDFCGNTRRIEQTVQTKLRDGAFAEVLGANIIGRTLSGSMEHRFATPIDLSALSGGQSMELPVLAYKGIEIGRVTISLNAQGKVEAKYSITASSFVPTNGTAKVSTYNGKPGIEELVNGDHKVVIRDLHTAASGQLASIDVSDHRAADGSYSGVIWLYAQFDVKMDETSYANRGGRSVSFYRWLTRSLQTETLLNAVYSEMSAYEDNTAFYDQYQRFESISRTY